VAWERRMNIREPSLTRPSQRHRLGSLMDRRRPIWGPQEGGGASPAGVVGEGGGGSRWGAGQRYETWRRLDQRPRRVAPKRPHPDPVAPAAGHRRTEKEAACNSATVKTTLTDWPPRAPSLEGGSREGCQSSVPWSPDAQARNPGQQAIDTLPVESEKQIAASAGFTKRLAILASEDLGVPLPTRGTASRWLGLVVLSPQLEEGERQERRP
jgi:hypothetical protein